MGVIVNVTDRLDFDPALCGCDSFFRSGLPIIMISTVALMVIAATGLFERANGSGIRSQQ